MRPDHITLLRYWQKNNIWLNNETATLWLDVEDFKDAINTLGVPLQHKGGYTKLRCVCSIVGGNDVTDGCYLHSENLKV